MTEIKPRTITGGVTKYLVADQEFDTWGEAAAALDGEGGEVTIRCTVDTRETPMEWNPEKSYKEGDVVGYRPTPPEPSFWLRLAARFGLAELPDYEDRPTYYYQAVKVAPPCPFPPNLTPDLFVLTKIPPRLKSPAPPPPPSRKDMARR